MAARRVVVTGMGVVSPLGCDLNKFWERLLAGQSGIRRIQTFDPALYTSQIAGEVVEFNPDEFISKKEQRHMDPFCRYGVAAAKMALADSGLKLDQVNTERAGVVIGSGIGGLQVCLAQSISLHTRGPSRFSPFVIPQMITNILSGMVAIEFGFKGPNFTVVSACASATHSLGECLRMIQHGEADLMVSGGAEGSLCELAVGGFCAMRALSTRNDEPQRASRPFDRLRDGFVLGEGSGMVILEGLERARARDAKIYGEIIGYGSTADAFRITDVHPEGRGAISCMRMALKDALLDRVDYVNAHGTSTQVNDRVETLACKAVFGEEAYRIPVSSTKSMMGHLIAAAGATELILCLLAIRDQVLPPTINYENPDPDCDLDYVPNAARQQRCDVVLSNSLGFGGQNISLIVRRFTG